MKMYFMVTGMSCAACSARVQQAVEKLNMFSSVSVNLLTGKMCVVYSEEEILRKQRESIGESLTSEEMFRAEAANYVRERVSETVRKAGYAAKPFEDYADLSGQIIGGSDGPTAIILKKDKKKGSTTGGQFVRLMISIGLLICLAYITMGQMLGAPVPACINRNINPVCYTAVQFVLSLSIILINCHYFINGFRNLFRLSPNMDSLIAVGASVSMVYSIVLSVLLIPEAANGNITAAADKAGRLFYESAGMIPAFISIGKYLEARSKEKTRDSLKKLIQLRPVKALLYLNPDENGGNVTEKEIDISEIRTGDILIVKAGAAVPCDGKVVFGNGSLNESMLTGESMSVEKCVGDKVFEATVNRQGYFRMEAEKTGEETLFAGIIRLVEEASSTKAPVERLTDKISRIFVPTVLGLAVITFAVWMLAGAELSLAISMAVSVMVISCPCSLGLATPTAIMAGTGRGAELGILIKSAEGLEKLHRCDTIVFDKTGTLTLGKTGVAASKASEGTDRTLLLMLLGKLERMSAHPIGAAMAEYGEKLGKIAGRSLEGKYGSEPQDNLNGRLWDIYNSLSTNGTGFAAEDVPGGGLVVRTGNSQLLCGNLKLMKEHGVSENPELMEEYSVYVGKGYTVFFAALDKCMLGCIAISDTIKEDADEALKALKALGLETVMLTGDNEKTAAEIAGQAGISRVYASLSPIEKEKIIEKLHSEGHSTAMVGDGINDAPALMRADVGIAVGSGTDIAIDSAEIVITGDRLKSIATAVRLSKKTMRNIKQNLFWAFFYNLLGIPIAAGVLYPFCGVKLNPMIGAACMSLSSLFVVTNALRLRYFNKSE